MKDRHFFLVAFLVILAASARADEGTTTSLDPGPWKVAPQGDVKEAGEQLSVAGYADDKWLAAHVPGTAYADYVLAGREPDPNFGDNVQKADKKKYNQNYWYRTEFTVPADYFQGGRIWLNLDSVHRDGDVYLNGTKVGSMLGFFQRGRFDVTSLLKPDGKNALAVLAHIMVRPTAKGPDGKWNFNVSSPSLLCSGGWDWMPSVPGLNTGILKDVYLTHTGDVSLIDPWIRSDLPSLTEANLSIQAEVANASASAVSGELVGEINPGKIAFTATVTLQPSETQTVTLTASAIPALHLADPKLWWPNGYGAPNLYTCHLEFRTGDKVSDQKNITFGIKKYTYEVKDDVLYFYINGTRLFLKGGSWGLPEYLMRQRTAADYDIRVRLNRDEHFNIIRNWMGMVPDEAFYAACDKYGLMVWDEFWLNSHDGDPGDMPVYLANVVEKVKQMRNHPCIAFWVAQNEGVVADPPACDVNGPMTEIIKQYDGNDRAFHPNSNSGNLSGSGPWGNFDPAVYFRGTFTYGGEKPLSDKWQGDIYGLRSELGTAAFTSFDSFKKFMPKESFWPQNNMWNLHYLGPKARNAMPAVYVYKLGQHYGQASDIQDFCEKAQLLNLETLKGMFEAWLDHSDQHASGLMFWMSHPAYPCFVWQTYDYYEDTTGGYWGAKTACEPVHIYWNSNDDRIRVVNTTGKTVPKLKADLWIYNLDGTEKGHQTATVDAPYDKVADCFKLETPADVSPTHFLKLKLTDAAGNVVSNNFYWRGTEYGNYFSLSSMKPVQLAVTTPTSEVQPDGLTRLSLDVTNPAGSGTVALAIRPKPVTPSNGEQVLPVFMNDGYFSLVPGETRHVTIDYNPSDTGGETPKVEVECWNNFSHPVPTMPPPLPVKPPRPPKTT
jgi:hypothetical protein